MMGLDSSHIVSLLAVDFGTSVPSADALQKTLPIFLTHAHHVSFFCIWVHSVTEEAFDSLDAPPERITGAEVPMPYAANLEALALPTVADVVRVST